MMAMTAPIAVRQCVGLLHTLAEGDATPLHLVFRGARGELVSLAMDEPTAMAAMLAIRADVPADPDALAEARERHAIASMLDGMAVWHAGDGTLRPLAAGAPTIRVLDGAVAPDGTISVARVRTPDRPVSRAERAASIATFAASLVLGVSCVAVFAVAFLRVWGG